jgi:hypothetical protein
MPRGIIRVPEKTSLSTKLLEVLKKQFPDYEIEFYSLKPNYQQVYEKRMNLLHRAFEFLAKAYPSPLLTKETLIAYSRECQKNYRANSGPIKELQETLEKLTNQLVDAVITGWNRTGVQAAELLNEAEQYVLMVEGRPNLATLTHMPFGNLGAEFDYILQLDESLPPYSEELIKELTEIKAAKFPKTPLWLREFSNLDKHYIHTFFCNLKDKEIKKTVLNDFESFLMDWENLKKIRQIEVDLQCIVNRSLPFPAWFNELPENYREMMVELASEKVKTINEKLTSLKDILVFENFQLDSIIKLPQWYWVLSEHQQYFLQYILEDSPSIEEVLSFACSRLRSLPMPSNLAKHKLYAINNKNELIELYSSITRASHVASRDGIKHKWPKAVLRRHTLSNLLKVLEGADPNQVILFQTLISPLGSEDYIPILSSIIPDFKLNKMARTVLGDGAPVPPTLQTNHPLNKAKLIDYTVESNSDITTFLETIAPYEGKVSNLKNLMDNYRNVLRSGYGTATVLEGLCGLGRELFISSLEQMIILKISGYSFGSCVSGKDRKAISIIHTDAMYLYQLKYGELPLFQDKPQNRANFVNIVAGLYISRHHHEHAGQNGAIGIKHPSEYLAADIATEIMRCLGPDTLKNDDLTATNNEVREISKGSPHTKTKSLSPSDILLCKLIARQLGEERCTLLYSALYIAFNNLSQFEKAAGWGTTMFKGGGVVPKGIDKINGILKGGRAPGSNSLIRMTNIFEIILARPEEDESRTEATNTIYKLRELLKPGNKEESFDKRFQDRINECKALFQESKESVSNLNSSLNNV